MFDNFLIALTKRIVQIKLGKKDHKLPASFDEYLKNVSDNELVKDIRLVVEYLAGDRENPKIQKSGFFKALAIFLMNDFALKLDFLDADVVLYKQKDRKAMADKIINSDSELAETLKQILINYTYHQISAEIYQIAKQIMGSPYILVQSPREIDIELKREIRKKLASEHKDSFPVFQTNQKLIGGIRIFRDGESVDYSWLSKVFLYTSLTKA